MTIAIVIKLLTICWSKRSSYCVKDWLGVGTSGVMEMVGVALLVAIGSIEGEISSVGIGEVGEMVSITGIGETVGTILVSFFAGKFQDPEANK